MADLELWRATLYLGRMLYSGITVKEIFFQNMTLTEALARLIENTAKKNNIGSIIATIVLYVVRRFFGMVSILQNISKSRSMEEGRIY